MEQCAQFSTAKIKRIFIEKHSGFRVRSD